MFDKVIRSAETKFRRAIWSPTTWLKGQVRSRNVTKYGVTDYGGWRLVEDMMRKNGKVLLCGAGEDISFDLAIQKQFSCEIIIVDPTPRAIAHYEKILNTQKAGVRLGINGSSSVFYEYSGVDFAKINFVPLAVWHEETKLKFWRPYFDDHVSHSVTNYQGADSGYIEVDSDTLDHIAQRFGFSIGDVDLVKLDIEGAEYSVIEWMCKSQFLPRQILVEFDEMNFPNKLTEEKIKTVVSQLQQCGYELGHFDGSSNCVFVKG